MRLTSLQYINQTFTLAAPNLLINGHELPANSTLLTAASAEQADDQVEEYEPFSDSLRDRVAKLLQAESELLVEVGQLRREAPVKAAGMWKEELSWAEDIGKEEDMEIEEENVDLGVDKLERQDDVEANWKRGVSGLERLKKELPATAARMEKAKKAGEYALAER